MIASRRAKVSASILTALALAAGLLAVRVIGQTIPPACQPLGCFAAGVEGEIWQSVAPWGIPDDLSCTNADPKDPLEANRLCNGQPPPLGQFLYPYALAVDGARIYVSDQFNHRVQAFDFAGTPIPIANAIGNGTFGNGPGQLNAPEGLAVDAAHILMVADSYNSRIAVFDSAGVAAFAGQQFPIIDGVTGSPTTPTGIALTPGTTLLGYRTPAPAGDTDRIVVTDRNTCFLYIYDAGFNLKKQIPAAVPAGAYQGACVESANPSNPPPPGVFSAPSGTAIDEDGHIFVADYGNSRVQILDLNGTPIGSFGTPPDPSSLPPGVSPLPNSLQGPWAVLIDHTGRVAVTDTDNQRIAFFNVNFSSTPPAATFLFSLNAGGTLNGFPTGIAEQTLPDPAGRILVTDTVNHRVQRFQLPEIAIVQVSVDSATRTGSFGVVVPAEKVSIVANVLTQVTPTNATITSGPLAQPPANPSAQIDISPGQIVRYTFSYAPIVSGPVSFVVSASANNAITAKVVNAVATLACTDCSATAVIYRSPLTSPPALAVATANWYKTPVVVRITANSSNPLGLGQIAYQFTSGPEMAIHGGTVNLAPVTGPSAFIDVPITQEKTSVLTFWAVNADGSAQAAQTLRLSLDLSAPRVTFKFPAPSGVDAAGAPWSNAAVVVPYIVSDDLSGSATANGSLSFTLERRSQTQSLVATDRAGNSGTVASDLQQFGGRPVNIDTRPPVFGASPTAVTVELTGPGVGVLTAAQAPAFKITATDPVLLGDGTAGSGVVSINNPVAGVTTFPMVGDGPTTTPYVFTARDGAGNSAARSVDVTVRDTRPPVFTLCPSTLALSGPPPVWPNLSASVAASDLSGTATITQSPAVGTALGLGSQPVTLTATDPSGNRATCAITVTVRDTTPPVLTLPGNLTVPMTTVTGAAAGITYAATALDAVDNSRPVNCSPASGSTFPSGTTTVTCSATDLSNNTVTGTFTVTVDPAVPVMFLPAPITVSPPGPVAVSFAATFGDLVDGFHPATCTPASGATFPLGTTAVSCVGTTPGGTTVRGTFTVTVTNPLVCSAVASPSVLWPPNHKLTTISLSGITGAGGAAVKTTITSIFQDEPTNGLGDGDTPIDGYGVGTGSAQLRSERAGDGDGRVYYISYQAATSAGSCTGTVTVAVPHDQAQAATGQGPRYDSTKAVALDDDCHGLEGHGHHDDDGCDENHHGHFDGDNCRGRTGYHHSGDGDRDREGDRGHRRGDR